MSREQATDFNRRIRELADEFRQTGDETASHVYGLTASVFLTDTPTMKPGR